MEKGCLGLICSVSFASNSLNDTLIYAKVHDNTIRRQFATAMKQIEVLAVTAPESTILEDVYEKSVPLPDI